MTDAVNQNKIVDGSEKALAVKPVEEQAHAKMLEETSNSIRFDPKSPDLTPGGGPKAEQDKPDPTKGLTKEQIEAIDKIIAKEHKPLVQLRYLEKGWEADGIKAGPFINERVYKNGQYVAFHSIGLGDGAIPVTTSVKVHGVWYDDLVSQAAKDTLLRNNVPQGKVIPKVPEGSKEYNNVMQKIHSIDFDRIPDWTWTKK